MTTCFMGSTDWRNVPHFGDAGSGLVPRQGFRRCSAAGAGTYPSIRLENEAGVLARAWKRTPFQFCVTVSSAFRRGEDGRIDRVVATRCPFASMKRQVLRSSHGPRCDAELDGAIAPVRCTRVATGAPTSTAVADGSQQQGAAMVRTNTGCPLPRAARSSFTGLLFMVAISTCWKFRREEGTRELEALAPVSVSPSWSVRDGDAMSRRGNATPASRRCDRKDDSCPGG